MHDTEISPVLEFRHVEGQWDEQLHGAPSTA
jgi:hypothetical protein